MSVVFFSIITKESSKITGVDEDLIRRFGVIMIALSSGYQINIENFDSFPRATAALNVEKYSWYRMPVIVHKILISCQICITTYWYYVRRGTRSQ